MKRIVLIIALLVPFTVNAGGLMMSSGTRAAAGGACTWSTVWDAETVTGDSTWADWTAADRADRTYIMSADTTGGGSKIRITFVAHSTNAGQITDAAIGPKKASADPYDFDSAPTNITFGGSDSGTLPAGGTLVSDEITFTFSTSTDYIISHWSSDGDMGYLDASGDQVKKNIATDETETVDVTGYVSHAFIEYLWKVEACN